MRRFLLMFITTVTLVAALSSPAAAQDTEVLFVLTEETRKGDAEPREKFWWSVGGAPVWTESDDAIFSALEATSIEPARPTDLSRVSKIYRRPGLSRANALALASVFGVSKVVVGTIRLTRLEGNPLGLVGYRAEIDAALVSPGREGPVVAAELPVSRISFGGRGEGALNRARQEAADALATLLETSQRRRVGPVGLATDEPLIAIHGASKMERVDEMSTMLEKKTGVDAVVIRWASEGIIALEINPETIDPSATIGQLADALESHGFDNFRLERFDGTLDNVIEFRVLPSQGG